MNLPQNGRHYNCESGFSNKTLKIQKKIHINGRVECCSEDFMVKKNNYF